MDFFAAVGRVRRAGICMVVVPPPTALVRLEDKSEGNAEITLLMRLVSGLARKEMLSSIASLS
jgi:hypothetical protein